MVMYFYVRSTSQEREGSCICMLGVQARGEWSCICMLGVQARSEWSCICMLGVQTRRVSGHVFVCYEYKPGE